MPSSSHLAPASCLFWGYCTCLSSPDLVFLGFAVPSLPVLVDFSIGYCCAGFWEAFSFGVGLVPKIGKEHEEDCAVDPDEVDEDGVLVVAGRHEVILRNVDGDQDELNQLDGGHVFLPPEILLEAWTGSREPVVKVHDDMD